MRGRQCLGIEPGHLRVKLALSWCLFFWPTRRPYRLIAATVGFHLPRYQVTALTSSHPFAGSSPRRLAGMGSDRFLFAVHHAAQHRFRSMPVYTSHAFLHHRPLSLGSKFEHRTTSTLIRAHKRLMERGIPRHGHKNRLRQPHVFYIRHGGHTRIAEISARYHPAGFVRCDVQICTPPASCNW